MTSRGVPDLIVVGAGVVGLSHAVEAHLRGLSVLVLERDERAAGASVRNFGHVCMTGQSGTALAYARAARERWIELSERAGFEVLRHGTVVVARTVAEAGVLEELAAERGADEVVLLTAEEVAGRLGWRPPETVAGAWFPRDLRVDPRAALPALAGWLESQGVQVRYGVNVGRVADGVVLTPDGEIRGEQVVHAVGHDVDRLFPEVARKHAVRRCRLQMFEVAPPHERGIAPAVLTGSSLLRYGGLASMPSADLVRAAFLEQQPELLEVGLNLMLTQRPDGSVVLGDTHHYERTSSPFEDEPVAELVLREGARLFGGPLTVRRRWRGVYASSESTDFVTETTDPRTRVVSVTSGIGMTTALGLAPAVLDEVLARA